MKFNFISRACRSALIGATLICSAACITINEKLGEGLIPTNHLWEVCIEEDYLSSEEITLKSSGKLSAYNSRRMTFGEATGPLGTCVKGTSFTLVPVIPYPDLGDVQEILQFHFSAVRDTLSTVQDYKQSCIQNVMVYELRHPLDSTVLYTDGFNPGVKSIADPAIDNKDYFVNLEEGPITIGSPTYNGSDSLSFDFSKKFAQKVIDGIKATRELDEDKRDTLKYYLDFVPGIYIETEKSMGGGRINMFDLPLELDSYGFVTGNYAELKLRTKYNGVAKDTSFLFFYGPAEYYDDLDIDSPAQFAFNSSYHTYTDGSKDYESGVPATDEIILEGGSGIKPVIKAEALKKKIHEMIKKSGYNGNPKDIVINKATIEFPYDAGYEALEKYPDILSPTLRLSSKEDGENSVEYIVYAGITDSSIESENQGGINRSLSMYCPDMSHHIQEILDLEKGKGEDVPASETDQEYEERLERYDVWMLIMHEEVTVTNSSYNNDYYNNLLYNSYYNNMMYNPYGYGYGGYGGYGYGGYGYGGYGYDNYYNYMMMAAYASTSSTTESVSTDLDKDRYYYGTLCGPNASDDEKKPKVRITFSYPLGNE